MVEELKNFMTTLGDKMNARELEDMVKVIFKEKDELVECEGMPNFVDIGWIYEKYFIFRILFPALRECERFSNRQRQIKTEGEN